jgi:hypothetical protein
MLAPTASDSSLPQGSIFRNGLDPVDTEFDAPRHRRLVVDGVRFDFETLILRLGHRRAVVVRRVLAQSVSPMLSLCLRGLFALLDACLTTLLEGAGDRIGHRVPVWRTLREAAALALLVDEEDRAAR